MLAMLPAAVRCGPPPWNSEHECASTLGPTNTNPGNAAATSAIAASCSGGTAIVSPAVGGVGQSMLFGPRIWVTEIDAPHARPLRLEVVHGLRDAGAPLGLRLVLEADGAEHQAIRRARAVRAHRVDLGRPERALEVRPHFDVGVLAPFDLPARVVDHVLEPGREPFLGQLSTGDLTADEGAARPPVPPLPLAPPRPPAPADAAAAATSLRRPPLRRGPRRPRCRPSPSAAAARAAALRRLPSCRRLHRRFPRRRRRCPACFPRPPRRLPAPPPVRAVATSAADCRTPPAPVDPAVLDRRRTAPPVDPPAALPALPPEPVELCAPAPPVPPDPSPEEHDAASDAARRMAPQRTTTRAKRPFATDRLSMSFRDLRFVRTVDATCATSAARGSPRRCLPA